MIRSRFYNSFFSCVLLSRINIVEFRIKILLTHAGVRHSTLDGIDGLDGSYFFKENKGRSTEVLSLKLRWNILKLHISEMISAEMLPGWRRHSQSQPSRPVMSILREPGEIPGCQHDFPG